MNFALGSPGLCRMRSQLIGDIKEKDMVQIIMEQLANRPMGQQRVELLECKGTGHTDTMCDAISEAVSMALCRGLKRSMCGQLPGTTS